MQQPESGCRSSFPLSLGTISAPEESLKVLEFGNERGRRMEGEERRKTIEKWNWSGALSHKEINVSGSHTEKRTEI